MADARFEIITTSHGAQALRDRESGEVMHPGAGPLYEAEALYVTPCRLVERLTEASPDPLVLFDVGLGAGTNAVSALSCAERLASTTRRLEIVSFDLTCEALRHVCQSADPNAFGFTPDLLHAARALLSQQRYESERVTWRLVLGDALESLARLPSQLADIVFWDLYSPRTSPSLWSESAFARLRRVCSEGATVHTYSAATATRSALLLAGFYVGLGPPASAKQKHTTLAATRLCDLARPLDRCWLACFPRSFPNVARDPALSRAAHARLLLLPQLA